MRCRGVLERQVLATGREGRAAPRVPVSTMRYEPCLCGGLIAAPSMRQAAGAVLRHNMSLTHCVWRLRREGPTATFTVRDLSETLRRASVPPAKEPAQ